MDMPDKSKETRNTAASSHAIPVSAEDIGHVQRSSIDADRILQERKRGLFLVLLVCIAAMVGDALDVISDSSGFEIDGQRWVSNVTYYTLPGCPAFVNDAMEPVIANMTPISHGYGGHNHAVAFDYRVTIYCATQQVEAFSVLPADVESDLLYLTDQQGSAAGSARRYWSRDSKEMLDCDIWLNEDKIASDNIDIVLGHEWGHCLGLKHENQVLSLMNSFLQLIFSAEPTIDDRAGLNVLYELCVDELDERNNHFMHKVPVDGEYYYGIMPGDGMWPHDVHTVGKSSC